MDAAAKARIASIICKAVRDYLRDDQRAAYPLTGDVWVTVGSRRVARRLAGLEGRGGEFTTADGSLTLTRLDERRVRVTAHAFQRASKLWNGPDVLRNNRLESMFASLFHDLLWIHRKEIAEALGTTADEVMRAADDVFILAWRAIDPSLMGRVRSWIAFQAVEFAVPWYHKAKDRANGAATALAAAAMLCGCSGCHSLPDGEVEDVGGVEIVEQVMRDWGDGLAPMEVETSENTAAEEQTQCRP